MSATFDSAGIQQGAGFNVKNNEATQLTVGGVNNFRIISANNVDLRNSKIVVTPLGTTGTNSLFTFNHFVRIELTGSGSELRITFSDPFNINITNNTIPFSIYVTAINPNISPNP